jgi:hypothetical protein
MLNERMRVELEQISSEIFLLCLTPVLIFDNGHGPLEESEQRQRRKNLSADNRPQK